MDYVKHYDEIEELREYIKDCKKLTAEQRLDYAEESKRSWYELMPPESKRNFERLRWKDIIDKF